MVTAYLTDDGNFLHLIATNYFEVERLRQAFTVKVSNWFVLAKTKPGIPIETAFMNAEDYIPVGLWLELVEACKKHSIDLKFGNEFAMRTTNSDITRLEFDEYIKTLFTGDLQPKDYQMDAVYNMIKYKKGCIEVSTSGGKTLISYMLFRFLIDKLNVKRILFVTPNTNLTTQTADKFKLYDSQNGKDSSWTSACIYATARKEAKYDQTIIFGNYQSLVKKKADFFKDIEVIIIDECHHSNARSERIIIRNCKNAEYKFGMTGTFPKSGSHESFTIQAYIGPIIYRLTSHDLINKEKFATPVYVNCIELDYLEPEKKQALYQMRLSKIPNDPQEGNKLYNIEKEISRDNPIRFKYICEMIEKTTKNSLVIFSDIQTKYGMKFYDYLKENTPKNVYYIDGEIKSAVRDQIKQNMEDDKTGNTIIVASMGCFSEGIDIANLWNIFLIESTKSENTVAQLLGRGMRRYEGKDKTVMIDFVDDFRFGDVKGYIYNYLYRHGQERQLIYKQRGFPLSVVPVQLRNAQMTLF